MKTTRLILRYTFSLTVLLGIIALSYWFVGVVQENAVVSTLLNAYGYFGIVVVSFISGFNLLVPIPAVSLLPAFLAAGLSFWPIIFLMAIGMTLADSASYFLGKSSRMLFTDFHGHLHQLDAVRKKHKSWPLFGLAAWAALAPLPNEVLVIPLSFLGYRLRYIFPILFIGNFAFNALAAFGIVQLFNVL